IDTAHFSALIEGTKKVVEADPDQKLFADLLPTAHCRPVIPVGALLWDKLTDAWNYALYDKKTPEQALRDAQNEVQAALDKALAEEKSK
ncbi:MAG: ABC transporter substrate-binding protein, partial [Thermotoga sp.]